MADRTLTINHADGGSETYTLKTEDVLGVRSMQVDGETVTVDRTAPYLVRTIIADGQTITIDTTREGVRTLTVDGTEITLDRTEESNLNVFLQKFTGAAAAYSLRDLASPSGNTTVVRVRRASDNAEADFSAKEVSDGPLVTWVGAGNDGFVETWYDQSGNNKDAVQLTAGSQPKIVDAGVLVSGGLDFDGVNDYLGDISNLVSGTTASSCFIMGNADTAGVNEAMISQGNNSLVGSAYVITSEIAFRLGGNTVYDDDFVDANSLLLTTIAPSSSTSADVLTFLNGSAMGQISTTSTALDYTVSSAEIGANKSATFYDGRLSEIIFYASDQTANRVAIETNINDHYSIY